MEFEIIYFNDKEGKVPLEEFLIELKKVNPILAQRAFGGIEKLRNRVYHKEPLSKYIELGLWELRIIANTNILRILYTFTKGRKIILLHIFIKKQQKTPIGELEIARTRLKELKAREES